MSEPIDLCPECNGAGRIFIPISDDRRREIICRKCMGYGAHHLLMAAILSGTYVAPPDILDEIKKPSFGEWSRF